MEKINNVLRVIFIVFFALLMLSPIVWILTTLTLFLKVFLTLIVVVLTLHVFVEAFDRTIKTAKQEFNKVTRFEYITDKGRQVVEYGEFDFELQDDNRTLKVFKK